jgi:5-formyltetrahydrofolate cyclo-ligase
MIKKEVHREKGKQILHNLSLEAREKLSKQIAEHVLLTSWWKQAKMIGITIPQKDELDTTFIIKKAWEQNKGVAVPKCYPKNNNEMIFYEITDWDQLDKGYVGIYEPDPAKCRPVHKKEINIMFVPGVLFGRNGYRIGYGGGYYDRYLKDFQALTVSLAIEKQIVQQVPHEDYDLPVNQIITENGIIF